MGSRLSPAANMNSEAITPMPEPRAAWRNIAEQVMYQDLAVLDRQVALSLHVPALLTRLSSREFPRNRNFGVGIIHGLEHKVP
jgi:hypothetical protein